MSGFCGREKTLAGEGLTAVLPAEADYLAGVDAVPHLRVLDSVYCYMTFVS